jgi:CDP-diacylglycerol--glycerol-3-phosphate 3-phosphatidyltransferase
MNDSFCAWLLLAPFALFFAVRAVQYALLRAAGRNIPLDEYTRSRGESEWLGQTVQQLFIWATEPMVSLVSRGRVGPNTLTVLCLVMSVAAGVLIAFEQVATGGALVLLGSGLDNFDGRVARRQGRQTRAGSFLDSTLDRYSEVGFLAGAAVLFRESVPMLAACLLCMGSGGVISYTRAKAESLGASLRVGLMQRTERVLLFSAGAFLGPLFDPVLPCTFQGGNLVFASSVVLLALLSTLTAAHRVLSGMALLRE